MKEVNKITHIKKLHDRLKEIDDLIQKLEKEKGHIEYAQNLFNNTSDLEKNNQKSSNKKMFTDKRKVYVNILRDDFRGETVTAAEIRRKLTEKGYDILNPTHHANLSLLVKDLRVPIDRVKIGLYKYAGPLY